MSTTLKARAKRLRSAVTAMFNVPVSVAQSLELVAREENFPNWDSASACFERVLQQPEPAPTGERQIVSAGGGLEAIFSEHHSLLSSVRTLLASSGRGSLLIVAGPIGVGKTHTIHLLVSDICSQSGCDIKLLHAGVQEQSYPSNVIVNHRLTGSDLLEREWDEPYIHISEIRSEADLFHAVTLAHAGYKVVCTLQATTGQVEAALYRLLSGARKKLLSALINQGQALIVSQVSRLRAS